MEDYSDDILDTSLDHDVQQTPHSHKKKKPQFNLEECLDILDRSGPIPNPNDERRFTDILLGLGIFDRSTFANLEPVGFIKKLMLLMKHEVFLPGTPIYHYNQPEDKICIIVKGKAKVFVPKTGHEMEKESKKKKIGIYTIHHKKLLDSVSELSDNTNKIRSEKSVDQTKSLANIPSDPQLKGDYEDLLAQRKARSKKKLVKAKTYAINSKEKLPSQTILHTQSDVLNTHPQSSKELEEEGHPSTSSLQDVEVDEELYREFRKLLKNYFVGEILKVKFSKVVGSGNHFGIGGIGKNKISKQTLVAADECHCLTLYKEDYLMALNQEKNLNSGKIEFFRKMFPDYEEEILVEFALLWDKSIHKRGDVIYQENDEDYSRFYIVFEGEVLISKEVEEFGQGKLTDRSQGGKKKDNATTLHIATLCQGYFFGEEFFKKMERVFTATVSSSKAKILQICLKDYRLLGKRYFDFFIKIKEMIQLSYKLNTGRLESLYQSHGVEVNRQAVHEDYIDQKEKLAKAESYSRKDLPISTRKIISLTSKSKNLDIRKQYDKYFVCKPGQKYPEYLKIVMQTEDQPSPKPENRENLNMVSIASFSRRTNSLAVQTRESPETSFNFVKPKVQSKVDSKFKISIPRIDDFQPMIIDTFGPSTVRTLPIKDPIFNSLRESLERSAIISNTSKSTTSKGNLIKHLSHRNLFTDRAPHQEQIEEEEEEIMLDGRSEIIPLDLKSPTNQEMSSFSKRGIQLNPLEKIASTLESNRLHQKKIIMKRRPPPRLAERNPFSVLNSDSISIEGTPKMRADKKMVLAKKIPVNYVLPSLSPFDGKDLDLKSPNKLFKGVKLPHIRSKSINPKA